MVLFHSSLFFGDFDDVIKESSKPISLAHVFLWGPFFIVAGIFLALSAHNYKRRADEDNVDGKEKAELVAKYRLRAALAGMCLFFGPIALVRHGYMLFKGKDDKKVARSLFDEFQ